MKPDLEPTPTHCPHAPTSHPQGAAADDDLDKQVDHMLDELEQRADDLFDSVRTAPTDSVDNSLDDLAETIANSEDAHKIEELEPEHNGEHDSVIDEASDMADAPDESLDHSIAQAVAGAEDALPDAPAHDIDSDHTELHDAVTQTDIDGQPTQEHEATRSDETGDLAPQTSQELPAVAPEPVMACEQAPPESPPSVEAKARPRASFKPFAPAAWTRAKTITSKVGGAAVGMMSRPLTMLDPAMRDYVGYAAAVTAFLGVCVWVLALI